MCGITGFNWNDSSLIRKMTDAIIHRGPDDFGFYEDTNISLGHRRLSILDLSQKGHQPMFNEDNTVVVVFNGEIYNYLNLKKDLEKKGHRFKSDSDTEVIIHGYEQYGEKISSMMEGMFAFALWDKKSKKLILSRDRIGKKPLYYYHHAGKLIFASEIKAILEYEEMNQDIDKQCLSDYLSLRYSPGNKTIFKSIKKLQPSTYLVYQKSGIKISRHWDLPKLTSTGIADEKEVDRLIKEAVEKRLMADVPIGVFLSGGLDSSTITAYMAGLTKKVNTYSVGFGDNTDETKYAHIISEKFNTNHKDILLDKNVLSCLPSVVWHLDEPLADPASLPTYLLCKEVSKNVKVALSGEGGDETFGGYHTFNYISKLEKINKIPQVIASPVGKALGALSKLFKYPKKQMLNLSSEMLENSKDIVENEKRLFYLPFDSKDKSKILNIENKRGINLKNYLDENITDKKDLRNQAIEYYFKEWLPNDLLMKVDKMSMAHSLEVRAPFLDTNLIKYFFSLNNKYKQDRLLFRKTVSKILPSEIMKKKKQGFTLPLSNWFTNREFNSKISSHFEDLIKRRFFNEKEYMKIIQNPSDFRNDHRMWVLLNFEIWNKLYVDKVNVENIKI